MSLICFTYIQETICIHLCFRYASAVLPITNFLNPVHITDINSFPASFQNSNHNLGVYFAAS